MAGFAEGFANGFGLVDAALQRRRANEIQQQQANDLAAKNQYDMTQQQLKNERDLKFHQDDVEDKKQGRLIEQDRLDYLTGKSDSDYRLQQTELDDQRSYRKAMVENERKKLDMDAMQARSAIDSNKADISAKQFRLKSEQDALAKQEALRRISPYFSTNQDGTSMLQLPGGDEGKRFLDDLKTGTGIDPYVLAKSYPAYKQAFGIAQQAAVNPDAFAHNQQPVLQALNTLEAVDINKGTGAYDGENPRYIGGTIERKEFSGTLYHPPEQGFPDGYYTFEVTQHGKDKDGKPFTDTGPLTEFRSSSAHDKNVRRITPQQLAQRLIGHEAVIQMFDSNPQILQHLAKLSGDKPEKGNFSPIVEENFNTETAANEKRVTGAFNKDTGEITPYKKPMSPEEQDLYDNSPQRSASQSPAQPPARQPQAAELAHMSPEKRRAYLNQLRQQQQGNP